MFSALFTLAMLFAASVCIGLSLTAWRNPDHWYLGEESREIEFHAWLDIGIFAVIGLICFGMAAIGIIL